MTRSIAVVPTFGKVIHRTTVAVEYFPTPPDTGPIWLVSIRLVSIRRRTGADQIGLVPIQDGLIPI